LAVCTASDLTSAATTAKPRTGFAGARRLDGGVERQEVGLSGDVADQLDDGADLLRGARQRRDVLIGRLRFADGGAHHFGALAQPLRDIGDRGRQLIGG